MSNPILYSFRRCPYAMRARLALHATKTLVNLREVVLREKPEEMLDASPKGTVPVLVFENGKILEESLDIMNWALKKSDKMGWKAFPDADLARMEALITACDGDFKSALDAYKYAGRENLEAAHAQRERGAHFIRRLDEMLKDQPFLFGARFSYADAAILPFVRQFAHVDRDWFWAQDWANVICWLEAFLESDAFKSIMLKYPQWKAGDSGVRFGE